MIAVGTAVVRTIFCFLSCILLLRTGRRVLGIVSAFGTGLASLVLAGYLLARKGQPTTEIDVSVISRFHHIEFLHSYTDINVL